MYSPNKYRVSKKIAHQQMAENEPDVEAKKRFQKDPLQYIRKTEQMNEYRNQQCVRSRNAEDKILVIESEKGIRNMLEVTLKQKGYSVVLAASGNEGIVANKKNITLILLSDACSDVSVRGIIPALKQRNPVPIIVMKSAKRKKVIDFLPEGADGYLVKPIEPEKLFIKIERVLNNAATEKKIPLEYVKFKNIMLNIYTHDVRCRGRTVNLTYAEYKVLSTLIEQPQKIFTRENLAEIAWPEQSKINGQSVSGVIFQIRGKLKKADPEIEYIETVWGIGYRMKE